MNVGVEVIGVRSPYRNALRTAGLQAVCPWSHRLHRLAPASLGFAALAGVAAAGAIALAVAGPTSRMLAPALVGIALVAAAGAAAARVAAVIGTWLEALGQAFDAAAEAQLIAAPNGRTVQANVAFKRLFPGAGEATLDLIEQAAADPTAAAAYRSLRERVTTGAPAVATIGLRLADCGPSRQFEISAELRAGRLRYCLWTFREIGAPCPGRAMPAEPRTGFADLLDQPPRHTRDRAAAGSRGPLERFFAEAPVGIAVVDRSGRVIKANRALGELFDAAPETLIGRGLIGLLNPEDRAVIAAKLADAAAGREDRMPAEIRLAPPAERTMVLLLCRLDNPEEERPTLRNHLSEGAPTGTIVQTSEPVADLTLYFIDVTEQKHLEAQVVQSQKMQAVGQLAGGVAHDFNNLLTAMIGFCDLLLLRSRPGDPAFSDIMQIKQNANRAANLVRQLLAFSRQQSLQPRVLDLTDILAELSHLLQRLIGENITLEFVHGRDLGLVKVDQGQLEQVVINLAVNARDAMPEGGRLTIRTEDWHQPRPVRRGHETMPAGDYVKIDIADTGSGIAPDNLARIFEPFFSTKKAGSGTGLGLSTVYGIVKQTGGFVFVDSSPGRGTTFAIYLPRHRAVDGAMAARPDAAEPAIPRDLTGTGTIMLVEDDDAVQMFGARALRNKGYRVIEAKSGEVALELIRNAEYRIDLLITDVVMPQMDGPALIREVRNVAPDLKVIFISGYTEDAFRQRLDSERDIHFLPKPFSLKQLAVKVKDVLTDDLERSQFRDCVRPNKIGTLSTSA